jgi:hypothetical protein
MAERVGYARLSLETGSFDFFAPARARYPKFGADQRHQPCQCWILIQFLRRGNNSPAIFSAVFCGHEST